MTKRELLVTVLAIEMMGRLPEWRKEERYNFAHELLQSLEMEIGCEDIEELLEGYLDER